MPGNEHARAMEMRAAQKRLFQLEDEEQHIINKIEGTKVVDKRRAELDACGIRLGLNTDTLYYQSSLYHVRARIADLQAFIKSGGEACRKEFYEVTSIDYED
jgi:enhancing lycopene biosynthesis protein 2